MARHVVNVIVGDVVLAALPHHHPHRMPIDQAAMVDMVADNLVLPVDILHAGPVSDQHDAALAHRADLVALDPVLLRVDIQPDGGAAAVAELAIFDRAVLRAAQAHKSVRLVDHFPVVLNADIVPGPDIAIRVGERQSAEDEVSNRHVGGTGDIDLTLHPDQFAQARRQDPLRLLRARPEVELAGMGIERPCARVVQNLENILHPGRRIPLLAVELAQGISAGQAGAGDARLFVYRLQPQDIHGRRIPDDDLGIVQVAPVADRAQRIVQVAQAARAIRAVGARGRITRDEGVSLRPGQMSLFVVQGAETAQRFGDIRHPHVAFGGNRQIGEHRLRLLPAFDFHAGSKEGLFTGNRLVSDGVLVRAGVLGCKDERIPQRVRATPNPDGDICLQPGSNQLADLVSATLDGGKGLALAAWILVPPAGSHAVLSAQNRNRTTPVRR